MGSLRAAEFADATREGMIHLQDAIRYHLESNHYPPIPYELFGGMALRAIQKAQRGEWEKGVRGPKGWEHRTYGAVMPVWAVVRELHLEEFVSGGEDE